MPSALIHSTSVLPLVGRILPSDWFRQTNEPRISAATRFSRLVCDLTHFLESALPKVARTSTMATTPASPTTSIADAQNDFAAFQMRPIIRDFKMVAELCASSGDTVLICGKGDQEKQGMLLISYDISPSLPASVRLNKVVRLSKKSVTQLETIPSLKIALLAADGVVSVMDIDSLADITTVTASLFCTW